MRILVDTNVWLDYFIGLRAGHDEAAAFLRGSERVEAQLLYPAATLQDVFYLMARELKRIARSVAPVTESDVQAIRRIAWGCIDNMRELATAVGMDESDLWLACKYRTLTWDLEDNVVLAAAQRAEVDYLVTNDRVLIQRATVPALTPKDMTALLDAR